MLEVALCLAELPVMRPEAIEKVRELESVAMTLPQTDIPTSHVFHAGMYGRTIMIPAGVMLTGALIKRATMLIVSGDCIVYIGNAAVKLTGYNVVPARANRKQVFMALTDTHMTMFFPTTVKNVAEAEVEFTDEADLLFSRKLEAQNHITVTGE